MLKKVFLTIFVCAPASIVLLSCGSSEQAARYRKNQEALQAYEKQQAEEDRANGVNRGVASREDREKQRQRDLDADKTIADLRAASPTDRDALNPIIAKLESYRACKAVPDLMHLLKDSPDDYVAGLSAQAIAMCYDRNTYETIIDQFLRRTPTAVMIDAIGKINTTDPRVVERIKKLCVEPNEDSSIPMFALRIKHQMEGALNRPI